MENPCEPIKRLLSRPDLEKLKKRLPKNFIPTAQIQYQELLKDLRKLEDDYPDKAKALVMNRKDISGTQKSDSNYKDVMNLYKVLQMNDAKKEEWNELHFLLDARFLLTKCKIDDSSAPLHQSTQSDKMTAHETKTKGHGAKVTVVCNEGLAMGPVLGSRLDNPTKQNDKARPLSKSFTPDVARSLDKSKDNIDLCNTYHGLQEEPGRQKPEQSIKPDKSENQQTDLNHTSEGTIKADNFDGIKGPIYHLISKHIGPTVCEKEAEKEYQTLLNYQLFRHRQIMQGSLEANTEIVDITREQREKSPVLYDYLKNTLENVKDSSKTLVKKALSEFIILTTAFKQSSTDKMGATVNIPKRDVPSASARCMHNKLSQSECANIKPIQKAIDKLKITCKNPTQLNAAQKQYCYLIKRDDNFNRKFPDKHRELQVFMTDPEECAFGPCKALYDALRQLKKNDPMYRETWEEFFFLVTSDQQYIIAEHFGGLIKTVYKKETDTMVIPRKSYEELQNELVEKIKQIDELTSRLSKFASQQLTAGNPNIADLSDKHRPTKIGEFYSELYDNEWSEAFEVIKPLVYPNATEDPDTEYFEEVLRILKNILMAAYKFSADRTKTHLKDIKLTLLRTITDQEKDEAKGTEYDRFVTEHAMKYRKEAAAYAIKAASKVFKRDGWQTFLKQKSEDPKLLAYVDKCVELTWYMRIQDPPMHLHCLQEKETISKAEFAFHGRKGKTTLVCVWPALLLFEGGHLVTKGHVLPEE